MASRKTVAQRPIPVAVVRWMSAGPTALARCTHCDWMQSAASLAECRIHVRHHPAHTVNRTEIRTTTVWAEDRDGIVLTEDRLD